MKPQKGLQAPNWTAIPNDLFDYWLPRLGSAELRMFLVIVRRTLGFHRRTFRASTTTMEDLTGLSRRSIRNGTSSLIQKGLIHNIQDSGITIWAVIVQPGEGKNCPLCGYTQLYYHGEPETPDPPVREFHNHHIIFNEFGGTNDSSNRIDICVDCHKKLHDIARKEIDKIEPPPSIYFKKLLGRVHGTKYHDEISGMLPSNTNGVRSNTPSIKKRKKDSYIHNKNINKQPVPEFYTCECGAITTSPKCEDCTDEENVN